MQLVPILYHYHYSVLHLCNDCKTILLCLHCASYLYVCVFSVFPPVLSSILGA
jgi:hypothetical protein